MTEHPEDKLRHLLGYIGLLRDDLRMQNWDIILHRDIGDEEDEIANTWQPENHTVSNVQLGPTFFEQSPERQSSTLLHELLHVQHRDLTLLWESCTLKNDDVPLSQARSWDDDFHVQIERFVSWVTNRVSPTIPVYDPEGSYGDYVGVYLFGEHPA